MQSLRERIIREVIARVSAAVSPTAVLRQPTIAVSRERSPALVLSVESDAPLARSNDRMERELVVRLTAIVRDPGDGYAVADDLVCRAHAALFADVTLGGLALAIACRRPPEWVSNLALDDAIRLAEAVFGANADFFIRRVVPEITRVSQTLGTLIPGRMPSPGSSDPATVIPTS